MHNFFHDKCFKHCTPKCASSIVHIQVPQAFIVHMIIYVGSLCACVCCLLRLPGRHEHVFNFMNFLVSHCCRCLHICVVSHNILLGLMFMCGIMHSWEFTCTGYVHTCTIVCPAAGNYF